MNLIYIIIYFFFLLNFVFIINLKQIYLFFNNNFKFCHFFISWIFFTRFNPIENLHYITIYFFFDIFLLKL